MKPIFWGASGYLVPKLPLGNGPARSSASNPRRRCDMPTWNGGANQRSGASDERVPKRSLGTRNPLPRAVPISKAYGEHWVEEKLFSLGHP